MTTTDKTISKMNRAFKYLMIAAVAVMMAACGRKEGRKVAEMGPEETAVEFCRAVVGGDFAEAAALCDTLTMKGYISSQEKAWSMLHKADSCACRIAVGLLAEAEMTVEEVIREGDERHVFLTIVFEENRKDKQVILKKEEGEWKVTAITDRN